MRHGKFTLMVKEPLESCGGAIKRHLELLPHNGDRQVNLIDASQYVWQKVAFLESRGISAVRCFVVGGPIDVIEDGPRETPSRQFPEVVEIEAVFQAHIQAPTEI
jgi:hypothetical protein